jgi:hypothetical protein
MTERNLPDFESKDSDRVTGSVVIEEECDTVVCVVFVDRFER